MSIKFKLEFISLFVRWHYLFLSLKPIIFYSPPSLPKLFIMADNVNFDMVRKLYGTLLSSFEFF